MRIFVVGGSGFVGRAVCRAALARGWEVLSLSRHGAPARVAGSSQADDRLAAGVKWIKGDALAPETFRERLAGCAAVVHSVGVLMENGYKQVADLGFRGGSARPATTYESANRDTALSVARAARATAGIEAFAYVSARDSIPFIDPRYIATKREVERELLAHAGQMRPIIVRPGFMYSPVRPVTLPIAAGTEVFRTLFNRTPLGCVLRDTPLAKAASPPLRCEL
ncbi:hypothetical protein IWQ56_002738, partial [Coemansia nantahalensis]